jgi:hypothetical protein
MSLRGRIAPVFLLAAGTVLAAACAASPAPTPAASSPATPSAVAANGLSTLAVYLSGVSCTGAWSCVAVGSAILRQNTAIVPEGEVVPVAETWNGRRWLGRRLPGPVGTALLGSRLEAVSCDGPRWCVAVGSHSTATGDQALADAWNGTRWRLLPLPYPHGASSVDLNGVSCRSGECLITGEYLASGQARPLGIELDGAAAQRLTPADVADGARLTGAWCSAPSACMAVGAYQPASGHHQMNLAEQRSGQQWHVLSVPSPANDLNGPGLTGVACAAAGLCLAVGQYNDIGTVPPQAFALDEIWQHGRWRALHLTGPGAAGFAPAAIACPSSSTCVAVGGTPSSGPPGAELWVGGSLRYLAVPHPQPGELYAISCVSARRCVAVGGAVGHPFADLWTGSVWQALSAP